ncbi:hypothetical protein ABZW03_24440, partial [Kitasatospora sp. NPDC004799]|uniref:hypothetical protein n=1 Tax=Kitasatospora sp. NPDC004799 TaxID=3154460 RepID=UPI0033A2B688
GGPRRGGGKAGGGGGAADESLGCVAALLVAVGALFAWMSTDAFFPGATDLTAVPPGYRVGFRLLYLCENLAFGAGLSFLVLGFPAVLRQGRSFGLSLLAHLSVGWLLVSWWPQDNLYRLTAATDWPRQTAMVFVFNVPLMLAAVVLVAFFLRKPTASKGR